MLAPRRVGKTSLMLELHRAPHENWDVVYIDVQSGDSAADCVAAILSALAARPEYRSRFEAIPFSKAVHDVLGRLSATVDTGVLPVELKSAIGATPRISFRRGSRGCRMLAAICWSSSTSFRFSFRECCGQEGRSAMRSC